MVSISHHQRSYHFTPIRMSLSYQKVQKVTNADKDTNRNFHTLLAECKLIVIMESQMKLLAPGFGRGTAPTSATATVATLGLSQKIEDLPL